MQRVLWRPIRQVTVPWLVALTLLAGPGGPLSAFGPSAFSYAHGLSGPSRADRGKPHHFSAYLAATASERARAAHPPASIASAKGPYAQAGAHHQPSPIVRGSAGPMQPGSVPLQPGQPAKFAGSDGRLELDIPAGAVTAQDAANAAGGGLALRVTQVLPASGASAGGSGHISLGTYLLQVVTKAGTLASHGLRQPVTFVYHLGPHDLGLNLGRSALVLNSAVPAGLTNPPSSPGGKPTPLRLGPSAAYRTTLDGSHRTLSATVPLAGPSTAGSFGTNSSVAAFGAPDPFNVDLNVGGLTAYLPIDLPRGPGGLTPQLALSYSSASVSQQHNSQAPAPWVGEGWSMSLGMISWDEHNYTSVCNPTCTSTWESSWVLTDAFGTSTALIPPNVGVATYYDDTPNVYFDGANYHNMPSQWHTAEESYAKVYAYVGPNSLAGMAAKPPCFRVWLKSGIMEEFGCTPDSLQYYPGSATSPTADRMANWLLDLITDPQGNQIHVTYTHNTDTETLYSISYPRDVELDTIEYDSPGCHDAQSVCTGSAWAPQMRVQFQASHSVAHVSGASCPANGNLRCDDPVDLSGSGGLASPTIMSTFVLNDIQVQVRTSGSGNWNTLRDYQLSYDQTAQSSSLGKDPITGQAVSYPGHLDLTRIRAIGDDGTTALPDWTFGYSTLTLHYEDSFKQPASGAGCGPSWNNSLCLLWNMNQPGNNQVMTSAANGQGLAKSFTWAEGRNNTHGVYVGSVTDPTACDGQEAHAPCNEADDQNWSQAIVSSNTSAVAWITQNGQGGQQTTTPENSTSEYTYALTYPLPAPQCPDCTQGMYWGDQNDADYLDYYNASFMGFAQANVTYPDGSVAVHKYDSTEGYGLYESGLPCYAQNHYACYVAPWWHLGNAGHGRATEADYYDTNGTTLLKKMTATYAAICPPSGVSGTPPSGGFNWGGQLVSELDLDNPVAVCDVQTASSTTSTYDGGSSHADATSSYQYDAFGRVTSTTSTTNGGSPTAVVHTTSYIWNDAVTATQTSATGTYLIDFPAFQDTEDTNSPYGRFSCTYTLYDGQSYLTGQQSGLTKGEATRRDRYTDCGTSGNGYAPGGQQVSTSAVYNTSGDALAGDTPDALAGVGGHTGCLSNGASYSNCTTYDGTYTTMPSAESNALGQTASIGYTLSAAGGFGLWPTSATDANSQTTSTTYDALGRETSTTLPGETGGETTTTTSYTVNCSGTGAQTPCVEIDTTQRLDSGTTVLVRHFYDGYGRLVETSAPAPGNQYVVQFAFYDPATGQLGFESQPYFVSAGGFSIPDTTQAGTSYAYDGLGRVTETTNALSQTSTSAYSSLCESLSGLGNGCYEQTTVVDPNAHQTATLADAWGRQAASQTFTGNSPSTYTSYQLTIDKYDENGDLTSILHPDGSTTTTMGYDLVGRMTSLHDPDRGVETYTYDPDGNLTTSVDARGSRGTVYASYDGLDRQVWRNTSNGPSGAYVTYSYDSTAGGNKGVGRLTGESFTGGPSNGWTGSYSYVYDGRGQQTSATETVNGTSYPTAATYNDAGQMLMQTYPDGEVVATSYTAQGWLSGLTTTPQGGSAITLLGNLSYSGPGGALGEPTGASLDGGSYSLTNSYDLLGRITDTRTTSNSSTLFEEQPGYDAAGNVVSASTTLPQGTDNQQFCYDEQNRLTWAGSTGTPPCTGTAIASGTLIAARYTQQFSYDTLDRLTSGPLGAYTYGDSAHLHAATAIGSTYTASYDASGNLTCRSAVIATTCAGGTQTGAQLGYDAEGRLTHWQNLPAAPTSTDDFLSDGEGQRVLQRVSVGGTVPVTTTVYVAKLEEVATSGPTTTTTSYYYAGGRRIALSVNGTLSYLASDLLGSAEVALPSNSQLAATSPSVLYAPYGAARYHLGLLPGSYGFTGQHDDTAVTGLDYYGARSYDPTAGQFASADTLLASGLNRYAYVGGNPESFTDPSGHLEGGEDDNIAGWGATWGDRGGGAVAPGSTAGTVARAVVSALTDVAEAGTLDELTAEMDVELEAEDVRLADVEQELDDARLRGSDPTKPTTTGPTETGTTDTRSGTGSTTTSGSGSGSGTPGGNSPPGGGASGGDDGSGGSGNINPSNYPPRPPYSGGPEPPTPTTPTDPATGRPMSTAKFGQQIGWGSTSSDAPRARILTITLQELQQMGVTQEMAGQWYRTYEYWEWANPGNPSAPGRADLMWYVYLLLGGNPAGP